ncbi:MAG: LysR family transcriptional regulator [Pseudomonadota bacterium]
MSFDWNQARAFWITAELGSLSAAARELGLTQPTVSRQVMALEEHLGVTLFERIGKSLAITQAGLDLLDEVREMGVASERVALVASGRSQAAHGTVVISASDGFSVHLLPPLLQRVRAAAPLVTLEIVSSNAISDLRRREADIAIRHVRPDQPDLVAKLTRESSGHLYASCDWIARNGRPRTPEDLSGADFIGFDQSDRFISELRKLGITVTQENFPLLSENSVAGWEMVKLGLGVGVAMRDIADMTPNVEQILPDLPSVLIPIWLVTHRELKTSRRIRVVFDILAEELAKSR